MTHSAQRVTIFSPPSFAPASRRVYPAGFRVNDWTSDVKQKSLSPMQ
jgi:hypothetical protein